MVAVHSCVSHEKEKNRETWKNSGLLPNGEDVVVVVCGPRGEEEQAGAVMGCIGPKLRGSKKGIVALLLGPKWEEEEVLVGYVWAEFW